MGYTINSDGSVTRDYTSNRKDRSNGSNNPNDSKNNSGCWFLIIIGIIIGVVIAKSGSNSSVDHNNEYVDSISADTTVVADPAYDNSNEAVTNEDFSSGYHEVTYNDGSTYNGNFKNGDRSGYGVYTWTNDSQGSLYKYEGNWTAGEMNGQGKGYYSDGATYEGHWKNGTWSGYGTETYPYNLGKTDGYIYMYEGEFKNFQRNGEGTAYYGDHTYQKGTWRNGNISYVEEEGTWN